MTTRSLDHIPGNRIRMVKLKEELEVLSDDSTDVFKQNIFDRYMDRPKSGKFAYLQNVSLTQFAYIKRVPLKMIISQRFWKRPSTR